MSYSQAVKFSRNHRKDRYTQPIVLGKFNDFRFCECYFVPHYNIEGDKEPNYYFCLRCGKKGNPTLNEEG